MVEISIIIPTKNNGDILEKCLASIENFIKEYRRKKAIREYVESDITLGKAAEIAGVPKRKFMAILKDTGIPLNVGVEDFVKGLGFLSKLRRYEIRSE